MRILLASFILAIPLGAFAQAINLELDGRSEVVVGAADCGRQVRATWDLVSVTAPCPPLQLFVTRQKSCPDLPTDDELLEEFSPVELSGSHSFGVTSLPLFVGEGAVGCPAEDTDVTFRVCASVDTTVTANCDRVVKSTTPPTLRYDTRPPGVPVVERAEPLDGAVSLRVKVDADTVTVFAEAKAEGQPTRKVERPVPTGNILLSGLANEIEYEVTAWARDAAGNESARSAPVMVSAVVTAGFWQAYREGGGSDTGGCSQTGGGALAALAALALGRITRRRRS